MLTRVRGQASGSTRAGLTIVELLVAMVIVAVVAGALTMTVFRQQQFYGGVGNLIGLRDNVRDATSILPEELRSLSPGAGDIYAMTDSSIDYRAARGTGVVCYIEPTGRASITLPPLQLASRAALTTWTSAPQKGDSLLIYSDTSTGSGAGVWQPYAVTADAAPGGSCPTTTGFTASATEAAAGVTLYVSPAAPPTVGAGSSVRVFRHGHYSLFNSPAGRWYLGFYDCLGLSSRPSPCNPITAVAGPFLPYAPSGATGLRFTYFDKTGASTAAPSAVARVKLSVRGQAVTTGPTFASSASGLSQDSLNLVIGIRNPP